MLYCSTVEAIGLNKHIQIDVLYMQYGWHKGGMFTGCTYNKWRSTVSTIHSFPAIEIWCVTSCITIIIILTVGYGIEVVVKESSLPS